jgi:hypothetical protein
VNQDLGRTISNRASRGTPARRVARHWATGTFTPSRTGRSQRCHVIDHRVRADDQASSPRLRIQLWWNRMPCPNISPVASAMPRPPDQVRGHCSPAQRRWQPRARCQRALSRLPEGQFSHALGSARARRACTRAVPPTDDRHATGRITDPGCLQRPYHQACRPAHPSACFQHRCPQLRCATRSPKSHRKPIPAPHEIRPGHGPRPARHYIVVASSSTQPGVGRRCRPCASRVQIWLICVPPRA